MNPAVGQVVRSNDGGHWCQIVAVDERFFYVMRADFSKRKLANARAGYPVPLSERDQWHLKPEVSPAKSGAA